MDIDQLVAFERIVREGSFSRAARGLNISQPTITARIQGLEEAIGSQLFRRGGRTITLTEQGESFLPYARRTLEVLNTGIEAAQSTCEGKRGKVTIGTLESLADGFLASAIAKFYRKHPQVELFIRTGHSNQIAEMLYDGLVRIGFVIESYFHPDLKPLLHFREPMICVAPKNHPLTGRGKVTLEEVWQQAHPYLFIRWHPSMSIPNTIQTGTIMEVPVQTVQQLLRHGIGVAFLTHTEAAEDLDEGRLIEIEVSDMSPIFRESKLVCLYRNERLPQAIIDFIEMVEREAGTMCVRP